MPDTNKIELKDTEIGGDFVGRDQHIYMAHNSPFSPILKKIRAGNHPKDDITFLDDLDSFMRAYKGDIIGLQKKLEDGKRDYLIEYAEDQKERYAKILLKSATLPFEQELHLKLLSSIRSRFQPIYGMITKGISDEKIDSEVQKLINEIELHLEDDPLNINREGIDGIIYYLTGNCFIKWN